MKARVYYTCGNEKPDLPHSAKIKPFFNGKWQKETTVGDLGWEGDPDYYPVEKFIITDVNLNHSS